MIKLYGMFYKNLDGEGHNLQSCCLVGIISYIVNKMEDHVYLQLPMHISLHPTLIYVNL